LEAVNKQALAAAAAGAAPQHMLLKLQFKLPKTCQKPAPVADQKHTVPLMMINLMNVLTTIGSE
jgi:hypothetical protein